MVVKSIQPYVKSLVQLRKPTEEDGAKIWQFIQNTGNLDLNSAYCYLMLCKFFPDTCVVAEKNEQIVGFVSAFRQPDAEDVIFVWQVAVASSQRGKGLATSLVKELLQRKACADVRFLEATVSPSNVPSQSLFKGLARFFRTNCEITECFSSKHFPVSGHEEEWIYRVGPFEIKQLK